MVEVNKKTTIDRAYFVFAIRIMGEFTFLIALPVVVFALLGKWLDGKYGTQPLFLISGFVLAVVISGFTVYRRIKELGKEYQELDK